MTTFSGLDVLVREDFARLKGRRVGLFTNPSAIDRQLHSAYQLFTDHPAVNVCALFGPEHGFSGAVADGEKVGSSVDARTRLPVYSLYGDTYGPSPEMLSGIDLLVCDIQDIGVRYYTFTWTVSHILEAAGANGVEVLILDRPNPSDGITLSGPLLEMAQSSLVGRFPVPVRHGLTLGELALMVNDIWNPTPAKVDVVACDGWQRGMTWSDTGLPWVPPSPGMPHLSTLAQYPGACLIEGTNLSEGRGTALPFEIVGAPWIDGFALAEYLNAQQWASDCGIGFRPHSFQPTSSKFAGEMCQGVQAYIINAEQWQPTLAWIGVIMTLRAQYPEQFAWQAYHDNRHHFDRLIGSAEVRQQIETAIEEGAPIYDVLAEVAVKWVGDSRAFAAQRAPYLLYE